jgi:hypothetical protein
VGFGRKAAAGEAKARQALGRAAAALRRYQRRGIPSLTAGEALELPGAGPETVPVPAMTPRDPLADPLTGAKWAGPPGSSPPGNP